MQRRARQYNSSLKRSEGERARQFSFSKVLLSRISRARRSGNNLRDVTTELPRAVLLIVSNGELFRSIY